MSEMSATQPAPTSSVTLLDIYTRQMEIGASLAVIHEQLKAVRDHEERIRRLEASRAKLVGATFAVSATVSALGTWVGLVVVHH
jgi:hypothetical protein